MESPVPQPSSPEPGRPSSLRLPAPTRRQQYASAAIVVGALLVIAVVGSGLLSGAGSHASASPSTGAVAADPTVAATETPSPTPEGSHDPRPQPPTGLTGYVWPLYDAKITLPYGNVPAGLGDFVVDGKPFHDGVDMATRCGDKVYAAHDGVVLATGVHYDDYMGWVESTASYYALLDRKRWWNTLPTTIVIDDGNGFRSIYAHESKVAVSPGDHVTAGQLIGYEGQTGNASGCHVHFGLFRTTETVTFALDPGIVSRDQMPAHEIARVNPLLVLPFRCEYREMRAVRPDEAKDCPPMLD